MMAQLGEPDGRRLASMLQLCGLAALAATLSVLLGLAGAAGPAVASKKSGRTIASDSSTGSPIPFWGAIECANPTRYRLARKGGDRRPRAAGKPQHNRSFRRMTVF